MNNHDPVGKARHLALIEKELRAIGENARFGFRPADDYLPRDTFFVAIECPGQPGNEVHHNAATLELALLGAQARRDDVLGRKEAA